MANNKKSKEQKFQEDYIKANRKGSREAAFEISSGFVAIHKTHKSKKTYSRKHFKLEY